MTTEQQELFARADNFVTTMIPLADQTRPYAMWYGWALNEAWRVGYAAGRAAQAEQTSGKAADVPRTQPDDAESPGPLDPIADLCARLRDEYEGCPSPVTTARVATLREAADALERLRVERDEARRECVEQARLLGMSGSREAALIAERDTLAAIVRAPNVCP